MIGYIRVVRPGSVIGPQQNYLQDMQARMWAEGDALRARQAAAAAPAFGKPLAKLAAGGLWGADSQPSTPSGAAGDRIGAFYPETPTAPARQQRSSAALDAASLTSRLGGLQLGGGGAQQPGAPYRTSSSGSARSASRGRSGSGGGSGGSGGGAAPAPTTPPSAASRAGASILLQGRPGTTPARPAATTLAAARASSADRSRERSGGLSVGGSYATLHTETTALVSRPRTIPERVSQSTQFLSGLLQLGGGGGGGAQPGADAAAAKSGVARVLAPNGQPRKVSAALLSGMNSTAALNALLDTEAAPAGGAARGRSGSSAWGGR